MAVLATDDFNRANAETPGAKWTQGTTIPARHGILSNQLKVATANTYAVDFYSDITWPDDHYSETRIPTVASLGIQSVDVRINTSGSYQGYLGGLAEGNNLLRIGKWFGGSFTTLAVGATNAAANQLWRLGAQGTQLRFHLDGAELLSATDASMSAGAPGFFTYHSSTTVGLYKDWVGGDYESSAPKAYVGMIVSSLDEGNEISRMTFQLSVSQSGVSYQTTVDVPILASDSVTTIRGKIIAAVQTVALLEYGLSLGASHVMLPDYYWGS